MSKTRSLICLSVLLFACGHDTTGPGGSNQAHVAAVLVAPGSATLLVGMSEQLSVTLKDPSNNTLSGRPVTWRSSNNALATISPTGLVTALGVGPVVITATAEGKAGQASLTINPVPVASVVVSPATGNLGLGQSSQLTATPRDSAGHALTGRLVTWSSNSAAVSVSAAGLVTAASLGSATITATSEGKSGTATISVDPTAVATVSIAPTSTSVQVGITTTLTATARDAGSAVLTGRVIAWTSSNPGIATVDANGVVTGVTLGSVTITATSEGKSGTAAVQVTAGAPATVVLAPSPVSLVAGDSIQLTAVVLDMAGDTLPGHVITWTSSASGLADVSSTGMVTSTSPGMAIITATTGSLSAADTVTITPIPVASIGISPLNPQIGVGLTVQLSATPQDAHGHALLNRPVLWSTSDSSVATVDGTGLVTAMGPGPVTVTATSGNTSASTVVTVDSQVVATVIVNPATASVGAGLAVQLTAVTLAGNGDTLTGRPITWSSTGPAIADVDSSGLVTGNLAGTTTITATAEGVSGTASITVVVNLAFPALDGGYAHTCSLTSTGVAYCWGQNAEGELGDGAFTPNSAVPVLVAGSTQFTSLYPGGKHTCALAQNGSAWCWGGNAFGQLGRGDQVNSEVPVPVSGGLTFTALTGGFSHACGLVTSGAAYCWGSNSQGELGDGTTTMRLTPTPVIGGRLFVALSARGSHTCGITQNGSTVCWGRNGDGELGDGTTTNRTSPVLVTGGLSFVSITTGAAHTCGLTAAGAAYCWGDNSMSEIGDGTNTNRSTPTAVTGGLQFTIVRARGTHTCAVTSSGAAWCWGRNAGGQLGDGTTTDRSSPVAVAGGLTFSEVSSGANFSCGVTNSPLLYCWGENSNGQLGDGSFVNSGVPVKVLGQP